MFQNLQARFAAYREHDHELARLNTTKLIFVFSVLIACNAAALFSLPRYGSRFGALAWAPFIVLIPATVLFAHFRKTLSASYRVLNTITALFGLCALLWAAAISAEHMRIERHVIIFVSTIFIVSFIAYIKPIITIVNYVTALVTFVVLCSYSAGVDELFNITTNKVFLFAFIGISISIFLYVTKMKECISKEEIEKKNIYLAGLNDTLKELNEKLARIASIDYLTSLYNRREFDVMLQKEWSSAIRDKTPLSMIMLDVDFFKTFNDRYGHLAGDDCLRELGRAFASVPSRPRDLVFRYGGEEFACILPDTDARGALHICAKFAQAVDDLAIPHEGFPESGRVTLSLGAVTSFPKQGEAVEAFKEKADKLLYRAKAEGRNRIAAETM